VGPTATALWMEMAHLQYVAAFESVFVHQLQWTM